MLKPRRRFSRNCRIKAEEASGSLESPIEKPLEGCQDSWKKLSPGGALFVPRNSLGPRGGKPGNERPATKGEPLRWTSKSRKSYILVDKIKYRKS